MQRSIGAVLPPAGPVPLAAARGGQAGLGKRLPSGGHAPGLSQPACAAHPASTGCWSGWVPRRVGA